MSISNHQKGKEIFMIIDMHRHPIALEWYSEHFWQGFSRMAMSSLERMGMSMDADMLMSGLLPQIFDTDGEKHLAQMEQAGIDKSVMFLFDVGLMVGEPQVSIEEQNLAVFEMAAKYPDKIIPFATIDPRRPNAKEFVKHCVEDHGAQGLKLHPSAGFNPEDQATLELIESIAHHRLPIVIHTGPSVPPTSSRYCEPIYLDEMLLAFPEVPVIAAHMGYGYYPQLLSLAQHRPNLFADLAAWQPMARDNYLEFAQIVKTAVNSIGADRILFATDSSFTWPLLSEADYVAKFKSLTTEPPEPFRLGESDIELILGGNATRLLKL
jgi:uncharacterized protein